tara:strand:+ start:50 stop:427 length:378 start_codon:yes stop_codon:yes gene_type:complete
MIDEQAIAAYNNRITATIGQLNRMTTAQQDAAKNHGSKAEALLANHDMVMFIHQFRFEVADAIAAIAAHDPESNARRVALGNQLSGIDAFIATLQRAVYMKNRVVSEQETPRSAPRETTKEVYQP